MANLFTTDDTTIFEFSLKNDLDSHSEIRLAVGMDGATLAMASLTRQYLLMSLDATFPRNYRIAEFQQTAERTEAWANLVARITTATNRTDATLLTTYTEKLDRYRTLIGWSEVVWEFLKEHFSDMEASTPVPADDRLRGLLTDDVEHTALNLLYAYLSQIPDHTFDVYTPDVYAR